MTLYFYYSGDNGVDWDNFVWTWMTTDFCLFHLGVMTADQITPNKEAIVIKEDETVTLSCSYTSSSNVYLYWYRQYPNEELHYSAGGGGSPSDPRFQSTTPQSSTELTITGVTLSDSALYYCALRVAAQWYKVYVKPYKNSIHFSL